MIPLGFGLSFSQMKALRILLTSVSVLCLMAISASAAVTWGTDYNKALAEAAKENKLVLINFTGSDWCPYCIALQKSIFSKPAFATYADKNLVLLEADFPQNKPQPEALKKQNLALAKKYKLNEMFPTLVLLNSKGKEIERNVGFLPGGPAAFIDWVNKARK